MAEIDLLSRYPRARRKLGKPRSLDPANRRAALKFGSEYFDGTREQGYGGYHYDGRWIPIARDIVTHFGLKEGDRVLDVGCAKGFLVKDLMAVCPGLQVFGLDISRYALTHCEPEVAGRLVRGTADELPFPNGSFQAVLCINVVHNLERRRCVRALREVERLAPGRGYIRVDAYRTEDERRVFLDWVLTALTFLRPEEWRGLMAEAGYTGDYSWTVLEADPEWNDFSSAEIEAEADDTGGARQPRR
ncbi:MAG: class I SAM-dependent methyltransferase [Gemmatimonadota bacterium]